MCCCALEGLSSCCKEQGRQRTRCAVEVEEGAGGEVHKLLAFAVEVERDLLRLRTPHCGQSERTCEFACTATFMLT